MSELPTISASRVPAVLGYDKRCSRLTLFLRMKGVLDEPNIDNDEAVLQGRFYERATADIACHKFGMRIVPGFEQMAMAAGNLSGHPDFGVVDEDGKLAPLEVKNPFNAFAGDDGDDAWGQPGTDEVPRAHLIQVMVYQELFRSYIAENDHSTLPKGCCYEEAPGADEYQVHPLADYGYVVARLRGGVERFKVHYDEAIIAKVRSEVDMMLERVRLDDQPDPEDEGDMRIAWMSDNEKKAACNLEMVSTLASIRRLGNQIRELEKQRSQLKTRVLGQAQEAGVLEFVDHSNGRRVDIATVKSTRLFDKQACMSNYSHLLAEKGYLVPDTTRLREEQKALYDSCMRVPEDVDEQTRQIRIKNKALDALLEEYGATNA